MVELRSFEGTAEELHRFVNGVWSASYQGRMPFPNWTPQYFEWHFGLAAGLPRDHLIAAYSGTRLVGTLLGIPLRFLIRGEEFSGTQGSWLSVDPDFRRQKIGSQLREHCLNVHREQGMRGQLGYIFKGSSLSLGKRYWATKQATGTPELRDVGFWVRVLDPRRAAAWNLNRLEGLATRLVSPLVFAPQAGDPNRLRPYQPDDLPQCLELANLAARTADCAILWTMETLSRHLSGHGVGACRVVVDAGKVCGFCSYHVLPFCGKTEEPIGIIDLVVTQPGQGHSILPLLNDVLCDLQSRGAILCLKMRAGDLPALSAFRAGFIPRLPDSSLCFSMTEPRQDYGIMGSLGILWR